MNFLLLTDALVGVFGLWFLANVMLAFWYELDLHAVVPIGLLAAGSYIIARLFG